MPTNIAVQEAAAVERKNGCPPPLDFRRRRELNWDHIEMEIHSIARRAMAVEIIGRSAQENVHGESLGEVFEFLANDMRGDIERLKELLGIGRESEEVQS